MSAELVHANVNDLDRLDPQSREVAVTSMLSEARQWLAHAVEATEPKRISEFKAFMATVAETTKQLNLSRDIQLDALEMVRRAERGVGKAIREGQESGEITSRGTHDNRSNQFATSGRDAGRTSSKSKPDDFLTKGHQQVQIYAMTDGVSDEEFDEALEAAKEEKDMTRANVVRKLRNGATNDETWDEVADLADQGWSSDQINTKLGLYGEARTLRAQALKKGIKFPADKSVGRSRRIDSNRVMRETVNAIASHIGNFDLVNYDDLDPEEAQEWVNSLTQSIKALSKARNQIKESLR